MRSQYPLTLPTLLSLNNLEIDPLRALLLGSGYLWADATVPPVDLIYTLTGGEPQTVQVTHIELTSTTVVLQSAGITLSLGDISYILLPDGSSYRNPTSSSPSPSPAPTS